MPPKKKIKTGIVGFGLSGRVFHAPFISTHNGFKLHSFVSSNNVAKQNYPKAKVFNDFLSLINNPEIELVVICTPHQLHAEQAAMALEKDKHVVIEKPVAMNSHDFYKVIEISKKYEKRIFPYHNRRWDGDFLTIRHIINEGYLGDIIDFESHFDRYSPLVNRAEWRYSHEDSGGTLFDLAPHLIDQAIALFGPPSSVFCSLYYQRQGSKVNDSFDLKLFYHKHTVTLKASVFAKEPGARYQVHGTSGSFIKFGIDSQEAALKAGKMPSSKNFGNDPAKYWGILNSNAYNKETRIRYATLPGKYIAFYDDVYAVINEQKKPEVTPEDALLNIKIIEAAMESAKERRIIEL